MLCWFGLGLVLFLVVVLVLGWRCRFGVDLVVIRFIMISMVSCGFGVSRCFLLGYFAACFVFCGVGCIWCLGLLLVVCFWLLVAAFLLFCVFCVMPFGLVGWCLCG